MDRGRLLVRDHRKQGGALKSSPSYISLYFLFVKVKMFILVSDGQREQFLVKQQKLDWMLLWRKSFKCGL